jgi:hypothetical protein
MTAERVNRSLVDPAMDDIDHALGRPLDPMRESYRNYYATDGAQADEMSASPYWIEGRAGTGLRCFAVSAEGRRALADHLRNIGDPHRAYTVTFDGHASTVIATSPSKARYTKYLDLSDCCPDLTFKDFSRRSSVRRAA